ncbi:MAG: hypothetical protein MRZ48_05190 [Anaerostipes hadrus]|nr:hypothetical protein [uncultured Anaerostipes sp.]MCI6009513.1 hypothetical protein [Anaerostipes hadrus]
MRKNKMMAAAFAVMMSVSMVVPTVVAESPVKAATSQTKSVRSIVNTVGTINTTSGQITEILPKETNAHFYELNLTSGGKFQMKGSAEGAIHVEIVDTNENKIWDFEEYRNTKFDRKVELAKGNYYVKIYARWDDQAGNPYTINTYFKNASYTFEENSNDDFFTANSINLNQVVRGHIAENNTEDYYKINLPAKGDYPIIYRADDGVCVQWTLYDSNFQKLSANSTYGGSEDTLTVDHAGTYYIRIVNRWDEKPTYWFKVVGKTPAKKTTVKVTAPKATYIKKLTKGSKRFKVSVKKQSATGYQVQYSLKSNFKGSKTKTFKGTSYTVKKLKGKKKYYVRVRSYKKSGSKTLYSAWSGKKSVKTKK